MCAVIIIYIIFHVYMYICVCIYRARLTDTLARLLKVEIAQVREYYSIVYIYDMYTRICVLYMYVFVVLVHV